EYDLTTIGIAGPLVKSKQTGKLSQVSDPPKQCPWQPVQDLAGHQGRTKLKTRTRRNRPTSQGERNFLLKDRLFVQKDNDRPRYAEPDHPRQSGGQVIIGQHTGALWVSLELDHVLLTVIGQHDARLRAAANLGDVCDCLDIHVADSVCFVWRLVMDAISGCVQTARGTRIPCARIFRGDD